MGERSAEAGDGGVGVQSISPAGGCRKERDFHWLSCDTVDAATRAARTVLVLFVVAELRGRGGSESSGVRVLALCPVQELTISRCCRDSAAWTGTTAAVATVDTVGKGTLATDDTPPSSLLRMCEWAGRMHGTGARSACAFTRRRVLAAVFAMLLLGVALPSMTLRSLSRARHMAALKKLRRPKSEMVSTERPSSTGDVW
jgi:hypothetical protein